MKPKSIIAAMTLATLALAGTAYASGEVKPYNLKAVGTATGEAVKEVKASWQVEGPLKEFTYLEVLQDGEVLKDIIHNIKEPYEVGVPETLLKAGHEYTFKACTINNEGYERNCTPGQSFRTTATAPEGPTAPTSGWVPVYADAFATEIGATAGQDHTWGKHTSNVGEKGIGNKSPPEIQKDDPSKVSTSLATGLTLTCTRLTEAERTKEEIELGEYYECGVIFAHKGSEYPEINLRRGETVAYQFVGTLPSNHGSADPGWWQDASWQVGKEFDFFELWGWGTECQTGGWTKCHGTYGRWFGGSQLKKVEWTPDPSLEDHTWTIKVYPTGGENYAFESYMDGVLVGSGSNKLPQKEEVEVHGRKEVKEEKDGLVLSYGQRKPCNPEPTCTGEQGFEGSNSMKVKYVGIWEDKEHVERNEGVTRRSIAPGTLVR